MFVPLLLLLSSTLTFPAYMYRMAMVVVVVVVVLEIVVRFNGTNTLAEQVHAVQVSTQVLVVGSEAAV